MSNLKIAVLSGGPSAEYDVSMKTANAVSSSLRKQNYSIKNIIVTKEREWLEDGIVKSSEQSLSDVDVVFLAMHGEYSEDGEIQKILQRLNLPFTGSRSLPSAIAFNKKLTKETLASYNILMPKHYAFRSHDEEFDIDSVVSDIKNQFGPEYMIKPVATGSSIGARMVREGESLKNAITEALVESDLLIVEEYIRGKEASCAVLENFRGENIYSFPTVELVYPSHFQFFTKEAKYSGDSQAICPSRFSYDERSMIESVSAKVHDILGLAQYSRSDFIVRDGKAYFLEVNSLPGLTPQSIFPKAAESVGLSFDQLIDHLIKTATV